MNIKKRGITLFTIVLLITLMAGMLASCTTVTDDTNTHPQSSNENREKKDTTTQEELDTQTGTTENNTSPTIKTDSGSYVG